MKPITSLDRKEVVSFRKSAAAGATGILSERIKANGTVEGLRVKFNQGQQNALRVNAYIEHKGKKNENMITYAASTNAYLAGDDDMLEFPVIIPVQYDDVIKVWYLNSDGTYAYTVVVDVIIDYYGGEKRIMGGAI